MKNWTNLLLIALLFLVAACNGGEDDFSPKPRGYFRIELPAREYQPLNIACPYTFEYNLNAQWQKARKDCWGDVYYPDIKGRLQLTYKDVKEYGIETLV